MDNTNETAEPSGASGGSVAGATAPLGWIETGVALPPLKENVLVFSMGRVITAIRLGTGWWRHEIDTGNETLSVSVCRPTHWQPLPAPPVTNK